MKPDVLVTGLGTVAARAGKTVCGGVPVVFMAVGDPVGANIVESLARPGGNVTGLSDLAAHIQGRRLALLREFAPAATIVAVVLNPGTPYTALAYKELEQAAKIVNIELRAFEVRSPEEITPQLEGHQGRWRRCPRDPRGSTHIKSAESDSYCRFSLGITRCLWLPRVC